jgi:DNA-directed RNA polymerase specialized sigma24 family protein
LTGDSHAHPLTPLRRFVESLGYGVSFKVIEEDRARLTAIAHRMLGSATDADDAVQEAWVRLSRSDADSIENLGGWLTTVLSRVCQNILQGRRSRAETPLDFDVPDARMPRLRSAGDRF